MIYKPPKLFQKHRFFYYIKKPGKLGKTGKAATFTYQETAAETIMRPALDTTVSL